MTFHSAHEGISKIVFLDHFSSSFLGQNGRISPIFQFDWVNDGQISYILSVDLKLNAYHPISICRWELD